MSKEEYLLLASAQYDAIHALKGSVDFYNYEKDFESLWLELGRQVLEKSISEVPTDRRKKQDFHTTWGYKCL
jgi:hypothetical protein